MAANATATKQTTRTSTASTPPKDERSIDAAVAYVRQTAERAVDVPVGAALTVAENVGETVRPWAEPTAREKELKQFRTQVTRELNRLERRGGQARRKATTRARGTRNRVERELKQRRNRVERAVKQNRTRAERELKARRTQVSKTVKDVQSAVSERVGVGATGEKTAA
jgi:prefoldin subunit 5